MVFICILGSVPFGVGLKGKEGHAFGPSKNKQNNIYYLYIFHYAYDSSPDEVLPNTHILTVPPHGVHAYFGLGTFGVGSKGKEGHPLLECTEVPLKNKPCNACYLSLLYTYIYIYIFKCGLMNVFRPKNTYSICASPWCLCIASARYRLGLG